MLPTDGKACALSYSCNTVTAPSMLHCTPPAAFATVYLTYKTSNVQTHKHMSTHAVSLLFTICVSNPGSVHASVLPATFAHAIWYSHPHPLFTQSVRSSWSSLATTYPVLLLAASFGISYSNGGPVSTIWGWVLVVSMTMFVGLAMAEIVSALPSSGGPYFWASVLGGRKWGPFAAFIAGMLAAA